MQVTLFGKQRPVWVAALAVVALTALLYVHFLVYFNREMTLLAAIALAVLFARGDLRRLWNWPSVLLLGYTAYTALSACWAISGKFFLNQYVKLFPAAVVFAAIVLYGRAEKTFVRRVVAVIADVSALLALLSVEGASTGLLRSILLAVADVDLEIYFSGSRMYGVFGNSNVEASIFAIGVLFSLPLLLEAKDKRERVLRAVTLAFNAFAFVLVFSMGAIVCFAVAVVVYLITSGKERGRVLSLMLSAAVPTLILAFSASRFFNAADALKLLPLLLMLLDAAVVAVLDQKVAERFGKALAAREKAFYGTLLAVVALLAVYILLALRVSAPYTFGGTLARYTRVAPGEHTLQIDADGPVEVTLLSANSAQALTGERETIYSGDAAGAAFTVPADNKEVRFYFAAEEGVTLRSVAIDGETPIMLRYRLLPSFVATRLQGTLTTSRSLLLRVMLWRDGLRFWRLAPVFGQGLGSFETGISRVQDFDYETKYVHNHYIQVLLEGGVIAFVLFLGALVTLIAALWKRRGALREGGYAALCAAFFAEFVMNGLQMIWDLSMSNVVFVCQTFAFYALLVLLCAEPLRVGRGARTADEPQAAAQGAAKTKEKGGRGKKGAARDTVAQEVRLACLAFPVFVAVTIAGNIISYNLINGTPATLEAYLSNLDLASKIDLYEHNDARLNYCLQVTEYEAWNHLTQANVYAERLSRLHSNSIHYFLIEFYFNSQQYDKAVEMPLLAAVYSASDESMWNDIILTLKQGLIDSGLLSPLLYEGETLLPKLMEYYEAWQQRNATAAVPITLTPESEMFFEVILALNDCRGDAVQTAKILSAF